MIRRKHEVDLLLNQKKYLLEKRREIEDWVKVLPTKKKVSIQRAHDVLKKVNRDLFKIKKELEKRETIMIGENGEVLITYRNDCL